MDQKRDGYRRWAAAGRGVGPVWVMGCPRGWHQRNRIGIGVGVCYIMLGAAGGEGEQERKGGEMSERYRTNNSTQNFSSRHSIGRFHNRFLLLPKECYFCISCSLYPAPSSSSFSSSSFCFLFCVVLFCFVLLCFALTE